MARIDPSEMERIACEEVPFVGQLGIRFEHIEDGTARAVLPMTAENGLLRPGGTISGPVMMGMADYVMYACVISMVGPALMAVTTNLNANFLRRPRPVDLVAEGRLLKCGKRLAYGEVTLWSAGAPEDPVCHVTLTYALPPADAG